MTTQAAFLPLLRELVRSYQAFERYSSAHVHSLGLTAPQFDIVATLGNTPGMKAKELGERTLITKGTLTGVVDRLERKGLVRRLPAPDDGRCQIVQLTAAGQALFDTIFPAHLAHLQRAFGRLDAAQLQQAELGLRGLRQALSAVQEELA